MARIACLVPARNEAEHLPGFLASAAAWADAVVALDDGSTDETGAVLRDSPLVKVLLSNPRHDDYREWDDSANRNRLLDAAADVAPDWIVSLDADERIPPDDAAALRRLVDTEARPGHAYGLQHFRMWGDRCDPGYTWIYRLFAWEPGQSFAAQRLHFVPVPANIPPADWRNTTIRVQHFAAASPERIRHRLLKYREADPDGVYPTDFGGLSRPPERIEPWAPRVPGLPGLMPAPAPLRVLAEEQPPGTVVRPGSVIAPPKAAAPERAEAARRPRLVCLLPARNCESDLPGWFRSVAPVADAVVALDDGSTDGTAEALGTHPLVERLVKNPRRDGYEGWDDAANRNRLLEAAAELEPDWVLSLDADERLDSSDATALRQFVDRDALPGLAYGFRVYRMAKDGHYDKAGLWVYRLHAYEPAQRVPAKRLHLVPVPTAIPRSRWVRTTLRIQHLASLTEERREARFRKYREADPGHEFQDAYTNLLEPPGELHRFEPRPPGLPVLESAAGDGTRVEAPGDEPLLSAIVISRDDEDRIERVVRSVVSQETPQPFEVIVVTSGTDRTGEIVRERFPEATLVQLPRPALPGAARNAGLRLARGDYASFPGSHVELPPGSLAARMRAHEQGFAMVTGTTLNGTHTCAGWATYFLDHSTVLPGRPSEQLRGPPAHCSYARHLLVQVGGFPEDLRAGEDTVVNRELFERRYRAYRAHDVRLEHASRARTPVRLVRHHFTRGRALGRLLVDDRAAGRASNRGIRRFLARYLPDRLSRTARNVELWGGPLRRVYRRVLPLVVAGALAAWLGTVWEIFAPRGAPRSDG